MMKNLVVLGLSLGLLTPAAPSRAQGEPLKLTAFAISVGIGPTAAGSVDISIERWTSDEQRAAINAALVESGPAGLLKALQSQGRVGVIRSPQRLGYDLRYAAETSYADGGRRILAITDRWVGFWEASDRPRTMEYPFTVIDVRLDATGRGHGTLSVAAKLQLSGDGRTVDVEEYGLQPVRLSDVKVVK